MKKYLSTILKYLFSLILILASMTTMHSSKMVLMSFMELLFIALLTNSLKHVNKHFQILNNILILLFNAQCLVLLFGNSYISYVMLENLDSIQALKGRAVAYSLGVIIVLVLSFLPVTVIRLKKNWMHVGAPVILALEIVSITFLGEGGPFTPAWGYQILYADAKEQYEMKQSVKAFVNNSDDISISDMFSLNELDGLDELETEVDAIAFMQDDSLKENEDIEVVNGEVSDEETTNEQEIENAEVEEKVGVDTTAIYDLPSDGYNLLGTDKNIILIFTEGLSKDIIFDNRNLMPNVAALRGQSIEFTNYYNHTFATYRGLQGQLYSGHQMENYESNHLTPIMNVLREAGYFTAMINVEAQNRTFTTYLNDLGFDEVYSDLAAGSNMLDAAAYEQLFQKALELQANGQRFFLTVYTFETHASFDSSDQVYGDGTDPELNKFYNCDYQFGRFFEAFKASPLMNDTAFIFTTDHATYGDELFVKSFPKLSQGRTCAGCDQIPFFVYFQGYNRAVDAQGRNSLDLAPTILDMLGLQSPETFLGNSLFYPKVKAHAMDTYFWCPGTVYFTGNNSMEDPGVRQGAAVTEMVTKYQYLIQQ